MSDELRLEEITELVSCALNVTGTMRPYNRTRVRVCEHLIGRGLLEAVRDGTCANMGSYPAVVPTLKKGAWVRLTEAGKLAVRGLEVRDYAKFFPVATDIVLARIRCQNGSNSAGKKESR